MICYNQKAHPGPHPFDLSGYQDGVCEGREEGARFIDKVEYVWNCAIKSKYLSCNENNDKLVIHPAHKDCGWVYQFTLNKEDFERLGRAFDMSPFDINEMLR
jgi:hypothetical protein